MKNEYRNSDTGADSARDLVRSLTREVARSQGGTEHASSPLDGSKGNEDKIDVSLDERVNCDPQGFQYTDRPRDDRYGGVDGAMYGKSGYFSCCDDMEMKKKNNSDGGGNEARY